MTDKEAMAMALEALELMYACYANPDWVSYKQQEDKILVQCIETIKSTRQAIAELESQEPVQDSTCNETLRGQGKAYPRTCKKCGLGPCIGKPKFDTTSPQRTWVGLTEEEMREIEKQFEAERVRTSDEEYLVIYPAAYWQWQRAIEAKLKEKNT